MALSDSTSGKIIRQYSIEELIDAANLIRGYDLVALDAAGSGHAGGTLSIMDITAALYLKIANHDPKNPDWHDRDRIIWSTGHKAPIQADASNSIYLTCSCARIIKRRIVKHLIVLAIALTLAASGEGCGGRPSAPFVSLQPARPPVVEAYGDSTMYGMVLVLSDDSYEQSKTNPPAVAQQLLRDNINTVARVKNEAVIGTTSVQLLAGNDGAHQAWPSTMASSPATIVVINHAINDVLNTPPDKYRQTLVSLIQVAKRAGKTVVMDTPNPVVDGGRLSSLVDSARLAQYAQIMRDVAAAQGATVCDEDKAIRDAGLNDLAHLPDGVHPNDLLYEFKGKTLAGCLSPLVSFQLPPQDHVQRL